MVVSCACFGPRHVPYSNYLCHAPDKAAVGTIVNVFSYDAVSDQDSNLSPSWQRAYELHVEPRSRVFWCKFFRIFLVFSDSFDDKCKNYTFIQIFWYFCIFSILCQKYFIKIRSFSFTRVGLAFVRLLHSHRYRYLKTTHVKCNN